MIFESHLESTLSAMADREKMRRRRKYKKLNISKSKRDFYILLKRFLNLLS